MRSQEAGWKPTEPKDYTLLIPQAPGLFLSHYSKAVPTVW